MSRLYSHPREYRKIFLGNYLCIVGTGKGATEGLESGTEHLRKTQLLFLRNLQKSTEFFLWS